MKRTFLYIMLLMASVASFAYDFEVDGIYYSVSSMDDLTCEVTYGINDYSGDIVIPSQVAYAGKVWDVTSIGEEAFADCRLTGVCIPNSVTSIGNLAFSYCYYLSSITIPNSVISIGDEAFEGCPRLISVIIPNSVTSIGDYAFRDCSHLTSVTIGNSVTSIGSGAFERCSCLTGVTIPNSVTSIGYEAFADCLILKEIISLAITPPECSSYTFRGVSVIDCIVKVPEESIDAYKAADVWKNFWNIVALGSDVEGGDDDPISETCAVPTISLQNGKLVITTATQGATCTTSITSADFLTTNESTIELTGLYTITSYAAKSGLWNSKTATATLVWTNPTIESTGIMSMPMKKALLLRSAGSSIIVDGLEREEALSLYTVDGMLLDKATANSESATLGSSLQKGNIYIIKVGDRSVKFKF